MVNMSQRVAWALTIYYLIYLLTLLGDQMKIFNTIEKDYASRQRGENDLPYRYEQVYFLDAPARGPI